MMKRVHNIHLHKNSCVITVDFRNELRRGMKDCNKILYFLDFPFIVGGSNIVLLTQAYIMKQRGYQVKVVIPNDERGTHAREYDRICDEYKLERLTAYYTVAICMEEIDIVAALKDYKTIIKILEDERPDLIHSVQLNITVELAARELKIPHLMNIYQVDRESFNVNWLNVYPEYHSADSAIMSERWKKGLNISSNCIRGAYKENRNGEITKYNEESTICMLSIGVLCRHKNQLECLKFVANCIENGYFVKLLVFGNEQNAYGELCKKYVEENQLQDHIQFMGYVSNVYDYFNRADLLIVASTVESYPSVIIASMANRIPVISTPVAGVPEVLKDGENGFLAEGYEANDLYKAFLQYLRYQNSGKLFQLVENAYDTYLKLHTYETIGNELEEYYQRIVNDYCNKGISYLKAHQIRNKLDDFWRMREVDITQIQTNKIWLLYHLISMVEQKNNKKVMIWGAGQWGKTTFEWINKLNAQIEFIGFIDSFKQGMYLNYPVVNEQDPIIDICGTVIVAVFDAKSRLEIMSYFDMRGKERNRDYFLIWNGPVRI